MSAGRSCYRFVMGCLVAVLLLVPPCAVLADGELSAGQTAFNSGQYDDALKQFDALVDSQPTSGDAHYWRAKTLAAMGRAKEAGGEYRMALLLTTDNNIKADCKTQLKQLNQAIPTGNVETALKTPKSFNLETRKLEWNLDSGLTAHLQSVLKAQDNELASAISRGNMGLQGGAFGGGVPMFPLGSNDPAFQAALNNGPIHAGTIDGEDKDEIKKCDVVLILDHSGSMGTRDCPGENGARLLWAAEELESFSQQLAAAMPHGFTFITYDTRPDLYDIRSSAQFDQVLGSLHAGGGTTLTPALEMAYSRHEMHKDQPLLIAVISDCQIDVNSSINSMVSATHRYALPNGAFFTFCQVGVSAEAGLAMQGGRGIASQLGQLKYAGASYDASVLIPFSQLRRMGLAKCILSLARAANPAPPQIKMTPPAPKQPASTTTKKK